MADAITYQEIKEIFEEINKKFNLDLNEYNVFLETGTNYGRTVFHRFNSFSRVS